MADDLWETGTILTDVANSDPAEGYAPFNVRELIDRAAADLKDKMNLRDVKFNIEGDCMVKAKQDDLYIAVIRVLQWLTQRRIETPPEIEPEIKVRCSNAEGHAQIVFEDRSNRLPERLREQLFTPFSVSVVPPVETKLRGPGLYLPLYLAKMLVEEKYGGGLDDRSAELKGDLGHLLVMRLGPAGGDQNNG
jgi:signal transduction histidine kinase